MGLSFTVGPPEAVFIESVCVAVRDALRQNFGYEFPAGESTGFTSEEVAWSGWAQLQARAENLGGATPHLAGVEAWQGVYLPLEIKPTEVTVPGMSGPLQCASLLGLAGELQVLALDADWPLDYQQLKDLWDIYQDDDDLVDEDMDLQTFIQACFGAEIALSRALPLWIVK